MARTVLLADDSVTAQNMGRRILTDAGYEVITVNNGSAALKKVHESRPDLIVLDVYMPGYGGLEVCQRLKESGDTMRIPVLLTVGKMEPFKSDEAKRVRADGHIVKPFEASELLAALTKLEDKIVPGVDARGRKGKSDKKSRTWHAGDEAAPQLPAEWTDRVAYLAEAKQRRVSDGPEAASEAIETVAPAPRKVVAPAEPAQEMPVIAEAAPDDNARFVDARVADVGEKSQAGTESPTIQADNKFEGTTPVATRAEAHQESTQHAVETKPTSAQDETTAAAETAPVTSVVKPRWVAENVALTAEEAALELDREMQQSQAQAGAPEATIATAEQVSAEPVAEVAAHESHERNGATFAAAASASVSSNAMASVAPQASSEEETAPAALDSAAAWKNWEQIRDSVMSAQNTDAIETVVSATTNTATQEPTQASAGPESNDAASTQPIEGEALASIVDSVLAELKPKLMEQIAKKLATEKK